MTGNDSSCKLLPKILQTQGKLRQYHVSNISQVTTLDVQSSFNRVLLKLSSRCLNADAIFINFADYWHVYKALYTLLKLPCFLCEKYLDCWCILCAQFTTLVFMLDLDSKHPVLNQYDAIYKCEEHFNINNASYSV